jgi:murein DD-endopeptidase MepM/ murein hydrolase activator NlpD
VLVAAALTACGQHPGVHEDGLTVATAPAGAVGEPGTESTPAGVTDGFTEGVRTSFDSAGDPGNPGRGSGSSRSSAEPGTSAVRGQGSVARGGSGDGGGGTGDGSRGNGSRGGDGSGEDVGVALPAGASTRSVRIGEGQGVVEDLTGDGVPDTGSLVVMLRGDGPLYTCPLWGRGYFSSSFGAYRPGPPAHAHAGNDIVAPYGTPILAPFDGRAEVVTSGPGGLGVKVFGADGYVYNAHLSAYGNLGDVEVGDVIGFVGNTGNAQFTVPHDHFEWHPGGGPAVDPFPYLNEVCA